MTTEELITLREAAERFNTTVRALAQAIHLGKLPAVKRGRDWFLIESDVVEYLDGRTLWGRWKDLER